MAIDLNFLIANIPFADSHILVFFLSLTLKLLMPVFISHVV
jgi:hypothetical protein